MKSVFQSICLLAAIIAVVVTTISGQTQPGSFDRIMIIMFENQPLFFTMFHAYFKELAHHKGTLLDHYHAVTHPSQPNYISQIAGDFFDHKSDSKIDLNATSVADLLEAKGFTWKSYQENYPEDQGCYLSSSESNLYYRKHNPFMSFINISQNKTRCVEHIVNAKQLQVDIERGQLPNLMYYTPNIDNDGHNTGLKYANKYLSEFLPPLLENSKFMNGTLIFVTFDEDDYLFNNKVYAVLLGPMVKAGGTDSSEYTHYSLLRTIEDNFELGTLGRNDAKATSFKSLNRSKKYYH